MTDAIREKMFQKIAAAAGVAREAVSDASTLDSLGLNSSDAAVLALEMEAETQQEIDVAIFLRFETLGEVADEIVRVVAQ